MHDRIKQLKEARKEVERICSYILNNPHSTPSEMKEAFNQRDINEAESFFDGMTEEEKVISQSEIEWETKCGCNGEDSPWHAYFNL